MAVTLKTIYSVWITELLKVKGTFLNCYVKLCLCYPGFSFMCDARTWEWYQSSECQTTPLTHQRPKNAKLIKCMQQLAKKKFGSFGKVSVFSFEAGWQFKFHAKLRQLHLTDQTLYWICWAVPLKWLHQLWVKTPPFHPPLCCYPAFTTLMDQTQYWAASASHHFSSDWIFFFFFAVVVTLRCVFIWN